MVYTNCREMGARWCVKTTVGRVRHGVQKPPWDGCAIVYENHCGMGGRWCTETTVRWVPDGA